MSAAHVAMIQEWAAGMELEPALVKVLADALSKATEHLECFSFQGKPFNKDETLAHWGHRHNLFTLGIKTLKEYNQLKATGKGDHEVRLFNFDQLHMDDEDDEWDIKLGSHVTIGEQKKDENDKVVDDRYVARVVELYVDLQGVRRMAVQWMYRLQDTPLAVPCIKNDDIGKKRKRPAAGELEMMSRLPLSGDGMPSCRVWLCGSSVDNERYFHTYDITNIDEPVDVYHVTPGFDTVEQVQKQFPKFNPETDYFYNQFTLKDFYTFEDLPVDLTPWSHKYRQIWDSTTGPARIELIKQLRGELTLANPDGGFERLMSLCRGAAAALGLPVNMELGAPACDASSRKQAQDGSKRLLRKLELFCGGGGLSFMAQEDDNNDIASCWANDINVSACATYVCNKPYTFVSCCGLEEFAQLCKKFQQGAEEVLGQEWRKRPELQPLLELPPGKRYSRLHLPEGVGCGGGKDLHHADLFVESAKKGEITRKQVIEDLLLPLRGKDRTQVERTLRKKASVNEDTDLRAATGRKPLSDADVERVMKEVEQLQAYLAEHDPSLHTLPEGWLEECLSLLPEQFQMPKGDSQKSSNDSKEGSDDSKEGPKNSKKGPKNSKKGPNDSTEGPKDSTEGSEVYKQHAAAIMAKLMPKKPSPAVFASAGDALQQQAKQQLKAKRSNGAAAAECVEEESLKTKIEKAYDDAREKQLEALEGGLKVQEDKKLGKVEAVRDVRICDCAVRVQYGSSSRQTLGALESWECWLEYEVQREGSSEWYWEHQALLRTADAVKPLQRFYLVMVADKTIPMQGDVDLMTGGPPCQNVSGLNRQAKQEDIMTDPKNRLVACYLSMIDHLKPSYLLIEQVVDIIKRCQAEYLRLTECLMLLHGYQARTGVLTAGNYGAPQGRLRCIIWGALAGHEQLPPFPAATFKCRDHGIGVKQGAEYSIVGAMPEGTKIGDLPPSKRLRPFQVWGDVTTDLPEVQNFQQDERLTYATEPHSFLQEFLRREPAVGELPLLLRTAHADAAMEPYVHPMFSKEEVLEALEGYNPALAMALGKDEVCSTSTWIHKLTEEEALKIIQEEAGTPQQQGKKQTQQQGKKKQQEKKKKEHEKNKKTAESDPADDVSPEGSGDNVDIDHTAEQEEEQEQEQEGVVQEEEDKAEAAELAKEKAKETCFATNVQMQHLVTSTEGDPRKLKALLLMSRTSRHGALVAAGVARLRALAAAHASDSLLGHVQNDLRDHRPYVCNLDDWQRVRALPQELGVCFRDLPGVVTNADKTCCTGGWHAATHAVDSKLLDQRVAEFNALPEEEQEKLNPYTFVFRGVETKCGCNGGGQGAKPPKGLFSSSGNDKSYRVDSYGERVKGTSLEGCDAQTFFLGTGGCLCPRWCITYNGGKSMGRNGCYGRLHAELIQPTVVTRPQPHNLMTVHDRLSRVVTVRENARCQAFPDYHVHVGLGKNTITERYLQVGNAVSPPMASALGRCLSLAAAGLAPVAVPVIYSADPDWEAALAQGQVTDPVHLAQGQVTDPQEGSQGDEAQPRLTHYSVKHNVSGDQPNFWVRHQQVERQGNGGAGGASKKSKSSKQQDEAAAAAAGAQPAAGEEPAAAMQPLAPKASKMKAAAAKKRAASAAAAEGSNAGPADAAAGDAAGGAGPKPDQHKKQRRADAPAAAAAGATGCRKSGRAAADATRAAMQRSLQDEKFDPMMLD